MFSQQNMITTHVFYPLDLLKERNNQGITDVFEGCDRVVLKSAPKPTFSFYCWTPSVRLHFLASPPVGCWHVPELSQWNENRSGFNHDQARLIKTSYVHSSMLFPLQLYECQNLNGYVIKLLIIGSPFSYPQPGIQNIFMDKFFDEKSILDLLCLHR